MSVAGILLICSMHALSCDEFNAREDAPMGNKHVSIEACEQFIEDRKHQFSALLGEDDYFKTVCRKAEEEIG